MARDATTGSTSTEFGLLNAEVIQATKRSSDMAAQHPRVGVVLPTCWGLPFLRELDESVGHEIHLLPSPSFSSVAEPFTVDAGQMAKEIASYVQCESLQGLTSLMCFPTLVQAAAIQIVNKTAPAPKKLHGPSFDSVALCCHKLLMRRLVEGACDRERLQVLDPRDLNGSEASESARLARLRGKLPDARFPLCIKFADTQFYVGTFRLQTWNQLEDFLNGSGVLNRYVRWVVLDGGHAHSHDVKEEFIKFRKRQEFYFEHLSGKLKKKLNFTEPSDISMFHFETWISNSSHRDLREYQVEAVVVEPSQVFIHDTGDIVHDKETGCLTLFRTPFSLGPDVPNLRRFLRGVVDSLTEWGWQYSAMDIEFKSTPDGTVMELIEVNSRYSYMGWHQYQLDREHGKDHMTERPELQHVVESYNNNHAERPRKSVGGHEHYSGMRNIANRFAVCLGKEPCVFPTSDHKGVAVLAAFFYTSEKGELNSIFDADAVKELANYFLPKPLAKPGEITDADCVQYHGWCKVGFLIDCIEDDPTFIDDHLKRVYEAAFKPRPGAKYLRPRVVDESKQLPLRYLQDASRPTSDSREEELQGWSGSSYKTGPGQATTAGQCTDRCNNSCVMM